MSDTAAALPGSQPHRRAAPAFRRKQRITPLEALERGFALFRSTFPTEAWRYYLGSAPLLVCFIPIWFVNGQIRLSAPSLLLESLVLTAAYVFRVLLVARYMQRVRERAFGTIAQEVSGAGETIGNAATLVKRKIFLSLLAVAALPTIAGGAWFYTASQFAGFANREESAPNASVRGSMSLASQWFSGGLALLFMLLPLWIAVWVNCAIVAILFPALLHSVFGVNTILSTQMGIIALMQSSAFWLSLFAGTWLALDPVVKCSFLIAFQELRARREGDDLRARLAALPRRKKSPMDSKSAGIQGKAVTAAVLALIATLAAAAFRPAPAAAREPAQSQIAAPTANDAARVQRLREALDAESRRSIYRWHEAEHQTAPNWFERWLMKIQDWFIRVRDAIWKFLRKLWPNNLGLPDMNGNVNKWKDLGLWLSVIAVVTIGAGAALVWLRRRRQTQSLAIPVGVAPLADLADDALATAHSEDEWFAMALRLEDQGQLRNALRAAYLGLLAGLAQREWLTIRRDRTNREYLDEFTRRWRRRPQASVEVRAEIPTKLRGSMRQFDRVWYGTLTPTAEAVATYRQEQRELLSHV